MPQNPCIIATKTPTADVLVFDYTKHPSKPGMNSIQLGKLKLFASFIKNNENSWEILLIGCNWRLETRP